MKVNLSVLALLALLKLSTAVSVWEFGKDVPGSILVAHKSNSIKIWNKYIRVPLTIAPCMKLVYVRVEVENHISNPSVTFNEDTNTVLIEYGLAQLSSSLYEVIAKAVPTYCAGRDNATPQPGQEQPSYLQPSYPQPSYPQPSYPLPSYQPQPSQQPIYSPPHPLPIYTQPIYLEPSNSLPSYPLHPSQQLSYLQPTTPELRQPSPKRPRYPEPSYSDPNYPDLFPYASHQENDFPEPPKIDRPKHQLPRQLPKPHKQKHKYPSYPIDIYEGQYDRIPSGYPGPNSCKICTYYEKKWTV